MGVPHSAPQTKRQQLIDMFDDGVFAMSKEDVLVGVCLVAVLVVL